MDSMNNLLWRPSFESVGVTHLSPGKQSDLLASPSKPFGRHIHIPDSRLMNEQKSCGTKNQPGFLDCSMEVMTAVDDDRPTTHHRPNQAAMRALIDWLTSWHYTLTSRMTDQTYS
ncbi:hypothetical protein PGTUg99_031225 [Puccinia graminis f. sp. tritici]|uniref:Uncharacterized protein n=1 Tax=Puccinia graminis f. sp. tritici TaxID=56615 RepID=A0A5B0LUC2_PUCGR|nr:hypothetical protein PGTUg99_031225 [Puccinia graminis f. sp. tritici]